MLAQSRHRLGFSTAWLVAIAVVAAPVPEVRAATGGPDSWGYSWLDSAEAGLTYHYEWAPSNMLMLGNEESITVNLNFDFPFYGDSFSLVKISANGVLHFDGSEMPGNNTLLPYETYRMIAPLWDNLNPETVSDPGQHGVFYGNTGVEPNRKFIVEWYYVPHYPAVGAAVFEAKLSEATGDIEFHYQTTDFGASAYDFGASATIGIQDGLNGHFLMHSIDEASLSENYAIRFERCDDDDGDGHTDEACGGQDCDDGDGEVYPGAVEDCSDGIDNDCDGDIDGNDGDCGGGDDDDDAAGDDDDTADDDDHTTPPVDDDDDRRDGPYGLRCAASGDPSNGPSAAALGLVVAVALRRRAGAARTRR